MDDIRYCGFEVGQHVVCVNDDEDAFLHYLRPGVPPMGGLNGLRAGKVYTVRDVFVPITADRVCVRLREIKRGGYCGEEAGYDAARFRPLPKLKVEDFMSAVAPSPTKGRQVPA